jgi:large subunit ribosomal protein L24
MKLKKGDTVQVIAGEAKGKRGKILEIFHERNRVVVDGVGRHVHYKKKGDGTKEGIEEFRAVHLSNVMILDPKEDKPTRIGIDVKDKKKTRVAKVSGTEIK